MANRLADQSSPYLLQHANNPVDWFPWGPEAFEKARREDKPLLISIGYSTCHWCHVMERESFENPAIAAVMNSHVVAVKVDREERPDVDRLYMTAVQALTGQGGWPLNVFVTPEGKPFIGGTYFPPETRHGRRGWPDVVTSIGQAWKDPASRERMIVQGEGLTQATREFLNPATGGGVHRPESADHCWQALEESFDPHGGGFSHSPKFPMPVNQFFLFRYAAAGGEEGDRARTMALDTLRGMAGGGIFDHLGGGFHRYSTDERWFLPHFEKMLYDNAQLAVNFLDAFQITRDPAFAGVAAKTLDYLLRDLCHPLGGFYSAEDADSLPPAGGATEKREGAFYVWSVEEVRRVLGEEDGTLFAARYGLADNGNVDNDPQGEFPGLNVLFESLPLDELANRHGISIDEAERRLKAAREKLLAVRGARPRPHLDDKILTSWNGLALSAFARGVCVLGEDKYRTAAQRAAAFLRNNLWDGERLFRRWRDGRRDIPALADDYAFLGQGLIDLYEADFNADHLLWAEQLTDQLLHRFSDPASGALFSTPTDHDPLLFVRAREEGDNVEPSAASVAAFNLLRLSRILGREDFRRSADRLIGAHLSGAAGARTFPVLNAAGLLADAPPRELVIAGAAPSLETEALLKVARSTFLPELTVILLDGKDHRLADRLPFLKEMHPLQGRPTAYYCRNFACQAPLTDPAELRSILAPLR